MIIFNCKLIMEQTLKIRGTKPQEDLISMQSNFSEWILQSSWRPVLKFSHLSLNGFLGLCSSYCVFKIHSSISDISVNNCIMVMLANVILKQAFIQRLHYKRYTLLSNKKKVQKSVVFNFPPFVLGHLFLSCSYTSMWVYPLHCT